MAKRKHIHKLDPNIIRIGDFVKVKIPKRFVRVGYPLHAEELAAKLMNDETPCMKAAIDMVMEEAHKILGLTQEHTTSRYKSAKGSPNDIYKGIARDIVLQHNFGGGTRSAHEEDADFLRDHEYEVQDIKYYRGGEYYRGYYDPYDGDSEPAGLSNVYTIKVLEIYASNHDRLLREGAQWILSDNCEKVRGSDQA